MLALWLPVAAPLLLCPMDVLPRVPVPRPARFVQKKCLQTLMVSATIVATGAESYAAKMGVAVDIAVVGQPTLHAWQSVANNTAAIRLKRRQILGEDTRPVFTYFGGYGNASYNQSVEMFASAVLGGTCRHAPTHQHAHFL